MRECSVCKRCFSDDIGVCPQDGEETKFSLSGEPIIDGRYQLERRLGQGGMGIVFQARHIFLKTQHAVKVILPDSLGNGHSSVTRFKQEALAAAAIRHQNIVAVTDFGVALNTMPYLVMEFIKGRSLEEIISDEGAMSPSAAFEFIRPIAAGVAAAHQQKIVHRDLKPLNIIVRDNTPIHEAIKILDFGLAKIKSPELLGSFMQAKTSGLIGSPYYMAPEQWSEEEPDARADIYSLGIMLYQMLAGAVPFDGSSGAVIMRKHLTELPPPFASRGVEIPEQVERVVRHALEKEVSARPPSVEAFINELRLALNSADPRSSSSIGNADSTNLTDSFSLHTGVTALRGELILIPGGEAIIGARDDVLYRLMQMHDVSAERMEQWMKPEARRINLPAFHIAQGTVSNDEYLEFVQDTGYNRPKHWQQSTGSFPSHLRDLPVVNVSFADAEAFCQWSNTRLPTNDEWERAARGNDGRAYPWGVAWEVETNGHVLRPKVAIANDQSEWRDAYPANTIERNEVTSEGLLPVYGLQEGKTPEGLLNMAGNVWEWADGGKGGMKHTRGGSYKCEGRFYSLAWFRLPTDPVITDDDVGFRYVRDDSATGRDRLLSLEELTTTVFVPEGVYNVGVTLAQCLALAEKFELSHESAQKVGRNQARQVHKSSFRIRKYLVTNEEYYEFVKQTGYLWPSHWSAELLKWSRSSLPFLDKYRYHPVTHVSYRDAVAFCFWRGGRLPTEEEWECAARGQTGNTYPWGDEFDPSRCNASESGWARTNRVNEYGSGVSPVGCFDMCGNVNEWTAADDSGNYFVRGGSFKDSGPLYCLTFLGMRADHELTNGEVGFRYVLK